MADSDQNPLTPPTAPTGGDLMTQESRGLDPEVTLTIAREVCAEYKSRRADHRLGNRRLIDVALDAVERQAVLGKGYAYPAARMASALLALEGIEVES